MSLTEKGGRSTEKKDTGSISESFFYFPDGRLKTAIAGGMRYEYTYDVSGRLKIKSASGRELISYGYDLNGNKTSQRDVTGNVTEYRYGISDELLEVYDKGVLRVSYEYNPDGTVKRQKTGNGTEILTDTCYAYDEDRNLTGLKTLIPVGWQNDYRTEPVQLVCNAYGYDRNGNRTFKETMGGRTEYKYDSRNRLEMVRYPDRWEKFGYDLAGNRKSRITGEGEENYTYDVRNRLLQVVRTAGNDAPMMAEWIPAGNILDGSGSAKHETARETKNVNMPSDSVKLKGNWQISKEEVWKYEYDRQGNLLKDNHAEYSYDGLNRMKKAETFTGKIQVNHYDAEGLRHEMEENGKLISFIYSDREVVAEREKESTIRYVRGYDIVCSDSECARMYYHYVCDEGGSTSHVLDETGRVLNQYEYDAFGNLIKAQEEVNNRFLYVGQQYDAVTMQYYLRARYYNPVVARFTQEDTYRGDGLNLYAYCRNNPVGYYDPSGHKSCPDKNGQSKETITGPNGTQITPEYDELVYGGYYGRKDARRQSQGTNQSGDKIGEKGTKISGSKTVGQNGSTERVDIENPNPGKGDGNMHYHEPDNSKWYYDFNSGKLVDSDGTPAPPKIQKVLKQDWVKKAIKKGKKYLGE